ncbi:MAG: methylmalonyl Co-A mutase-associated GTPase MeaB [bacterium]
MRSIEDLLRRFLAGDRAALSRIITLVENRDDGYAEILDRIFPATGRAYRIGITGPPGAGKSSLVASLVKVLRAGEARVGVIAVDPTSPFTGGALLGDRIRMQDIGCDPGVFVRSMATRGSLGGLAEAARDVADVMDAFANDFVITETVGVGQCELDIAEACHTTVVVIVPESGDSVQAMKAGLMEIADIIAINKSDREGADRIATETRAMLEMRGPGAGGVGSAHAVPAWHVPVLKTIASRGEGMVELRDAIQEHREFLDVSGMLEAHRRSNVEATIRGVVEAELRSRVWSPGRLERLETLVGKVMSGGLTPRQASREIISEIGGQ